MMGGSRRDAWSVGLPQVLIQAIEVWQTPLSSVGRELDIVHWSRVDDLALKEAVFRADETVFRWSKGAGKF